MTHILLDPHFCDSLEPVPVGPDAPAIARDMAEAAGRFGVGPMAAVAGAMSQAVADRFAADSPNLLIENGGDIYLRSTVERTVAPAGPTGGRGAPGAALCPGKNCRQPCAPPRPRSVLPSVWGRPTWVDGGGRPGRPWPDAAATALGNMLVTPEDMEGVLAAARAMARRGVRGAFLQLGELVGLVGDIELVALE